MLIHKYVILQINKTLNTFAAKIHSIKYMHSSHAPTRPCLVSCCENVQYFINNSNHDNN